MRWEGTGSRGVEAHSFVACLRRLTIDHAFLEKKGRTEGRGGSGGGEEGREGRGREGGGGGGEERDRRGEVGVGGSRGGGGGRRWGVLCVMLVLPLFM